MKRKVLHFYVRFRINSRAINTRKGDNNLNSQNDVIDPEIQSRAALVLLQHEVQGSDDRATCREEVLRNSSVHGEDGKNVCFKTDPR